jgi:pimeloyl-ACP methyl ester carboxylesterase
MNRFYNWVGDEAMLDEMRAVAPRIAGLTDFTREFLALAERALTNGQELKGAFYLRAAEFFMLPSDAGRGPTRERFLRLIKSYYGVTDADHSTIPYEDGELSAYRVAAANPKGTIVMFGGFDSYVEEWFVLQFALRDAGYEVIAFDGPGQGSALEDFNLVMTHEWEKPVKAVLDFFHLDDVTLLGFSLGGALVIRAAAHEPRVRRVIADDVLTDFSEVVLRQAGAANHFMLDALLKLGAARAINALVRRAARKSMVTEWGMQQGMRVMGSQSPYHFLRKIRLLATADVSARVTQDVLLMAGEQDHYVPLHQLHDQIKTLGNARSLTTRLFTPAEQAQNHCQIGNLGLSLQVIVAWLDERVPAQAAGLTMSGRLGAAGITSYP